MAAAYSLEKELEPDLLIKHLEGIVPFIIPHDILSLAGLIVERRLIDNVIKNDLEAMHESVTSQQKFRYLIWAMYSRKSSVNVFLRLLATLPSGKNVAKDYKRKSPPFKKEGFVNKFKKRSIYDWLVKRFSDPNIANNNQPLSLFSTNEIILDEGNKNPLVLLEGYSDAISRYVTYEWYKNGLLQKTTTPLLCIKIADISSEGKYTFLRNNELKTEINVHIKTNLDKFRQDLAKKYLYTVTNVDKDEWPKVKQNMYINLAVIKSDKSDNLSSYICQTIRGDADDVHGEKGKTDYKNAFETIQHGERVIVQGRPGSGKTTLVHKISQDWADHSIEWGHVKALFLIHLRGFRSRPSINLRDFLLCYFTSEETVKSIGDYIISKDGLGICFILDGLDEYQPDDKTAFVFQLIEKKVLSKAIVIVASRPAAVAKYRSMGKNIEVLGFFKDQISDYIDSYEFHSMSSTSMLKEYLTNRPNIHHMCYLPIQLSMICFLYDLFDKDGDEFPDTETDVYEHFTRHMILRTFYRRNIEGHLESIFSLPEEKRRLFRSICTLAFEKTLSSKQVLEQSEVDLFCEKMNTNSSLGLLTVDRKATKCGFQNMYTFCHLTFQEFLAACHIFLSSEVYQSELIAMCNEREHMSVVLKFFCGLAAGPETDFCTTFKNVMKSPHLNCLAKIHCAYESKQPAVCQYVAEDSTLNVTEIFLTTRDWTCIGFIIVNTSNHPIKGLHLNISGITEEGTESLKKILKQDKNSLKVEALRIFGIFDYIPQSFLDNFLFLRILSVTVNETTEYWSNFFSKFNHHNINIIHCCENSISKLAVKLDFSLLPETLSSSYKDVRTSSSLSQNPMYIPNQILKKSFKSISPFLAKECNSLLSEVCTSNKCIKLSCTKVEDADNIIMTIESGDTRIIKDIKNLSEIFADNYNDGSPAPEEILNCLDLISLADQIVLVYTQISLAESKLVIYILPKVFVIEEFIKNRKHMTNIKNLFTKRIADGMKLHTTGGASYLQNVDMQKICITQNSFDLNKKLGVIKLNQTIEQLHINSTDETFEIPESVVSRINLKCFSMHMKKPLNIEASRITNHSMKNLINALAYKDLQILDMSHCNLSAIIDSLLTALKDWINLTELYLKNCSITEKDVIYIVEGITASFHLCTLDLSDNKISDEGCQALAVLLRHESISGKCSSPHLHNLNLSCCHISDSGIMALAGSIQENCDIEVLDLSGNNCQSRVIPVLFSALQSCRKLSVLNLSHLSIGDFSVFSTLNSNSVEILNLCACEADLSSLSLAECSSLLSSLCVLDISENNWPMTEVAQVLNHAHNLQELSLNQISFISNDTKEFVRALKLLKNLKVLRLNHSTVRSGFIDFSSIMKSETIEVLEISNLICSSSKYISLCGNIWHATSLRTLDLSYIHFHEHNSFEAAPINKYDMEPSPYNEAAITLSHAIAFCPNLQELKLRDCGIKQTGAKALVISILRCRSLISVDLSQNGFSQIHKEVLCKLKKFKQLMEFKI